MQWQCCSDGEGIGNSIGNGVSGASNQHIGEEKVTINMGKEKIQMQQSTVSDKKQQLTTDHARVMTGR